LAYPSTMNTQFLDTIRLGGAESIDLLSLIEHRESVPGHESVGSVYAAFSRHGHEYVAVVEANKLLGLCSRGQIGYLLGSRYGFSMYS
jgi:hypothetical protein